METTKVRDYNRIGYAKHLLEVASSLNGARCKRSQFGLTMARKPMVESRFGTPYISMRQRQDEPAIELPSKAGVLEYRLKPAATIDITVVDSETGKPVSGNDAGFRLDGSHREYLWKLERPRGHPALNAPFRTRMEK